MPKAPAPIQQQKPKVLVKMPTRKSSAFDLDDVPRVSAQATAKVKPSAEFNQPYSKTQRRHPDAADRKAAPKEDLKPAPKVIKGVQLESLQEVRKRNTDTDPEARPWADVDLTWLTFNDALTVAQAKSIAKSAVKAQAAREAKEREEAAEQARAEKELERKIARLARTDPKAAERARREASEYHKAYGHIHTPEQIRELQEADLEDDFDERSRQRNAGERTPPSVRAIEAQMSNPETSLSSVKTRFTRNGVRFHPDHFLINQYGVHYKYPKQHAKMKPNGLFFPTQNYVAKLTDVDERPIPASVQRESYLAFRHHAALGAPLSYVISAPPDLAVAEFVALTVVNNFLVNASSKRVAWVEMNYDSSISDEDWFFSIVDPDLLVVTCVYPDMPIEHLMRLRKLLRLYANKPYIIVLASGEPFAFSVNRLFRHPSCVFYLPHYNVL